MKEITKKQYIERINDYERLYLVMTDDHNIYLKADIEYGGEIGLRIEMMDFKLDTSLTFWNARNHRVSTVRNADFTLFSRRR